MAFTSGFFNAVIDGGGNPDRAYDAGDMSRIFDGLIKDGVYAHIGDKFAVTTNPSNDLQVIVGTGRAWLMHTWSYNDDVYYVDAVEPHTTYDRIDALCIHVMNGDTESPNDRKCSIAWYQGVANQYHQKPTWTNTDTEGWFPLAFVYRHAGVREVVQADIEYVVGTDERMPYVLGVLDNVDISALFLQWTGQFEQFMNSEDTAFDAFLESEDAKFIAWLGATNQDGIKRTFNEWFANTQNAWNAWFANVQADMDEQTATRLANRIYELNARVIANGSKNYVKPEYTSGSDTINGIIFNFNSDGTVSLTGGRTAVGGDAVLDIKCDNTKFANKTSYKVCGCPSDGSSSTYYSAPLLLPSGSDTWTEDSHKDTGSTSTAFSFTSAYYKFGYRIVIKEGFTIPSEGLLFEPMICLSTETDTSFTEYVATNKVLTEAVKNIPEVEALIRSVASDVTALDGRVDNLDYYVEQTKTLSTSNDTVFTFTDPKIKTTSVIDVTSSIFKAVLRDVSVTQDGTCVVTYGAYTSAVSLSCRIYIHN